MASIPDVNSPEKKEPVITQSQPVDAATCTSSQEAINEPTGNSATVNEPTEKSDTSNQNPAEIVLSADDTLVDGVRAIDDTRYRKFFKMVQFGVPAPAVKLKMHAEGFDSSILE